MGRVNPCLLATAEPYRELFIGTDDHHIQPIGLIIFPLTVNNYLLHWGDGGYIASRIAQFL